MLDKLVEDLIDEFVCCHDGDCWGTIDKCKKCNEFCMTYEDFYRIVSKYQK